MRRARLLLVSLLALGCHTRACRDPSVWTPTDVEASRVTVAPVIDGDLSDAAWAAVPWTPDFRRSLANAAPRQRTRAKLAWDDANLYVAFEVEDDEILSPYTRDDEPLYESEAVELFVDANDDGATYDEMELSPGDVVFDASFVARRRVMNVGWNSGMRHGVKLSGTLNRPGDTDRGWTAEIAVPFSALQRVPNVPPKPGDRWRMNLFRLDHGARGHDGMALSPVMAPDFHNLPKYAHMTFRP